MTESEIINLIRAEVRKQMNAVLYGLSGNNDQQTEDIASLYPGASTFPSRPVMHPYGISSRAPGNTTQVVARIGEHPGNRMVLGHRDGARPSLNQGETILYNQFGQQIYLENGKIHVGSKSSASPMVLGDIFKTMMDNLLQAIASHTHLGNLGFPTGVPQNASAFTAIQASPVDDKAILSDHVFTEK